MARLSQMLAPLNKEAELRKEIAALKEENQRLAGENERLQTFLSIMRMRVTPDDVSVLPRPHQGSDDALPLLKEAFRDAQYSNHGIMHVSQLPTYLTASDYLVVDLFYNEKAIDMALIEHFDFIPEKAEMRTITTGGLAIKYTGVATYSSDNDQLILNP